MGSKTWDRIQGSWLTRLRISFTQQTRRCLTNSRMANRECLVFFPHDSTEALTRWRFVSNGRNLLYSSNDECSTVTSSHGLISRLDTLQLAATQLVPALPSS